MAKAAENYLKMHHPSLHKKMYGKGGKVKKMYKEGGYVSEFTYDPMPLRRNKVDLLQESIKANPKVLEKANNKLRDAVIDKQYKEGAVSEEPRYQEGGQVDQQSALEQELGQPIDGLMAKIGVPGFENGGKVEKKYTPIGDPSKLTWDYNKMSDAQKDSLVTSQEKHYESLGHSKTKMLKAYDNIKTNTLEMNEKDKTGGYEDYYAAVRAREIEKKKRYDAMAKSGQRTRGSGETIYRKDGGKVEKKTPEFKVGMYSSKQKFTRERTVAEKKKLKVLRTKSRKKKGK